MPTPTTARRWRAGLAMLGLAAAVAACDDNKLTSISNTNSYTSAGLAGDPVGGIQLAVNGILIQERGLYMGTVWQLGILGRENYYYFATDSRYVTDFLVGSGSPPVLDPGGFASGMWAGFFTNMRNEVNLQGIANAASITAAQKAGVNGFAQAWRANDVLWLLATRDSIGIPVDVNTDPLVVTNFVSRDSAYKFASAMLDSAVANLGAAGSSFIFSFPTGWGGFDTPAGFLQFVQGLRARTFALRGSILGNANCTGGCYQAALTALGASFLNGAPASVAALNAGPAWAFSTASGDAVNNLATDPNLVALYNINTFARTKADGVTPDDRYTRKIRTLAIPRAPAPGAPGNPTPFAFNIYATNVTPVPLMRNEELLLLRAEANIQTGNLAAATTDLNTVRTVSGGLPVIPTLASASAGVTELLYNRQWSLLLEGWRWRDARRFGVLGTLQLDRPNHFVAKVVPVPNAECLSRNKTAGNVPTGACP